MKDVEVRPQVMCLFCEDIREEVGNSESYIGVFRPTVNMPEIPIKLPKFAVAVHATFPLKYAPANLKFWVKSSWSDKPVFDMTLPTEMLARSKGSASEMMFLRLAAKQEEFEVREPGTLRGYVSVDGEPMEVGWIRFQTKENDSASNADTH